MSAPDQRVYIRYFEHCNGLRTIDANCRLEVIAGEMEVGGKKF